MIRNAVDAVIRVASDVRQDVTFGVRLIKRSPGFAAAAILTLSIAIGANTAVFTMINAVLFKPLPVASAHEVMRIYSGQSTMAWANYVDVRERNGVFEDVAAQKRVSAGLATDDRPVRLSGEATSANFFGVLGTQPTVGRTFLESDSRRDVVVLAEHLWRRRFNADPQMVGRIITLTGRSYEVIGVMPRGFRGVGPPGLPPDFWIPVDNLRPDPALSDRTATQFEVIGRLLPGVGATEAAAAMRVVGQQIRADYPEVAETFRELTVFSVQGLDAFRGMSGLVLPMLAFLALLSIISGMVLLIACANLAGLLIGRAAARRREVAIRLAIGAGRGRLVRQLIAESLILAVLGGIGGLLLANGLVKSVDTLVMRLPVTVELNVDFDRRVLVYTAALSIATAVLFGLLPARQAARVDLVSSLRDGGVGSTARQRTRRILVAGQVAASTVLLVWSGLFVGSLARLADVDPGFDPSGVLVASVELERGDHERSERFAVELQQRVAEHGAVRSTGMSTVVPLAMRGNEQFTVVLDEGDETVRQRVYGNRVTPGWFATLGIPFIAGRDFAWTDRAGAPEVAVVNERLARQFPNGDALGRRLRYGDRSIEVIGVVGDSKYGTLGESVQPTVYLAFTQSPLWWMALHVRTSDPVAVTRTIVEEMQRLAPGVAVDIEAMTDAVGAAVVPARIGAAATGALGVVAMLLAVLGVYALVANVVVQRTEEIGIRKAVGARTADILRLIVGSIARTTALGLAIGMIVGGAGATLMGGFIFGVSPGDPVTFGAVALLVMGSAIMASLIPALRCARVDPLLALRNR